MEVFERLGKTEDQANCLDTLGLLLLSNDQLDAAEDTVLRKIELLPEKGQEFQFCQSHYLLGKIYHHKGEKEKSVHHFETALAIASSFDWQDDLYSIHYAMAELFRDQGEFDNANTHIEQAKSHTADDTYNLGHGMEVQGGIWYRQCRLEDARPEVLGALEIFERIGAAKDAGRCRELLQTIEEAMGNRLSDSSGKFSSHANVPRPC